MSFSMFTPVSFDRIEPVIAIDAALEHLSNEATGSNGRIRAFEKSDGSTTVLKPNGAIVSVQAVLLDVFRAALMGGRLSSYVEDTTRSRYFRIPDGYWSFAAGGEPFSTVMAEYAAPGYAEGMAGQPILLSTSELERFEATLPLPEISVFLHNSQGTRQEPAPTDRTGAPGAPSSMHIIEEMMRERFKKHESRGTIGEEAKALAEIFAASAQYKGLRPATPKTIENALRGVYRTLLASVPHK